MFRFGQAGLIDLAVRFLEPALQTYPAIALFGVPLASLR
jgi:hypothetical protein